MRVARNKPSRHRPARFKTHGRPFSGAPKLGGNGVFMAAIRKDERAQAGTYAPCAIEPGATCQIGVAIQPDKIALSLNNRVWRVVEGKFSPRPQPAEWRVNGGVIRNTTLQIQP